MEATVTTFYPILILLMKVAIASAAVMIVWVGMALVQEWRAPRTDERRHRPPLRDPHEPLPRL
jgi:hypothetical protein